ncbi:hypothetical protein Tco_0833658, partial [Tanacetum coccineum]
ACEPALLLDESCLNQLDYSLGLLGKVKEFNSFDNMRMVLGNEGFDDINLRYMGEFPCTLKGGGLSGYVSIGIKINSSMTLSHMFNADVLFSWVNGIGNGRILLFGKDRWKEGGAAIERGFPSIYALEVRQTHFGSSSNSEQNSLSSPSLVGLSGQWHLNPKSGIIFWQFGRGVVKSIGG